MDRSRELFHGKAGKFVRILGKKTNINTAATSVRVVVWDLDHEGNIQKDSEGNIKVVVFTKNIESISVFKPKDLDVEFDER